jgi:hypothetical protein
MEDMEMDTLAAHNYQVRFYSGILPNLLGSEAGNRVKNHVRNV